MELTLDQALQKGIEAHKAGQIQDADRYYTAVLKADPKHSDANHNMGVLAVSVGKFETALPFLKTALEANPSIAQFWLSYINALIKLGRLADAKNVFDQAISRGAKGDGFDELEQRLKEASGWWSSKVTPIYPPDTNQNSALDLAIKLRDSGKFDQAIDLLKNEISQSPEDVDMLAALSYCHLLANQVEEAKIYLNKAKEISPDNATVGWNTARLMLKEQKPLEALNIARDTSQRFPDDVEGMGVLGALLRANGEMVESLSVLNTALELNPDYAEAYFNRGLIRLSQENKSEALPDFEKAHKLKPHVKQIGDLVIELKMEAQEYSDAIPLLINMIEINPENEKRFAALAVCYQHLNNYDQAVVFYKKAIALKTDFLEAWTNLGSALKEQGKLDQALEAHNKALSINPNYALAYDNMGNALQEQGKLDEAIEAYKKALSIKPDYAEAYNNMSNALQQQGKLEEAIEAYKKALTIEPDNAAVWSNLYFPIKAIKTKISTAEGLKSFLPQDDNSKFAKIRLGILDYKLHRGQESEEIYLDTALSLLSNADNAVIKNPKSDICPEDQIHSLPEKMVALMHWGRSGTGLLHSLIDGHPEVSTLPSIYLSEYFDHSIWTKIISSGWDGMVDHFMSTYDVLFDAASPIPVYSKGGKSLYKIGIKEGMANVGDQKNEVLRVNKGVFREALKSLMACYEDLDAAIFFRLVHAAYDKAIKDSSSKSLIFYHIHNPDIYAQLNFARLNPNANFLLMVREPIQNCESWVNKEKGKNRYSKISSVILFMLLEIDNPIYSRRSSMGFRLEDLKTKPHKTIPALCKWMGIKEEDSLYEMTAQGKKWWGDPSSPDYSKDGMEPFGTTSIKRKVGSLFSNNDQFILRTLFYPFSVRFGYTEENETQFESDLGTIRPMLDNLFDFERAIAEQMHMSCKKLVGSGSYLYLRSGLIERWNILNKYQTYPNMIRPLKI